MRASEVKAVALLSAIFALRLLGLFMIVPVFSLAGFDYAHATPFLIGLAVGVYGLTQALFQIPFSMLADRIPRKTVLSVGLILFAVGGALCAVSTSIYGVIFGRALAGSGAVSAVVIALIADLTSEQKRSQAMAVIGMVVAGSIALAFGFGPVLYELLGMPGLFWLSAATGVAALVLVWAAPSPKRMVRYHVGKPMQQLKGLLRASNFYPLYAATFVLHMLMTALFVLLPPVMEQQLGIEAKHHGWVYLPLLFVSFVFVVPLIIAAESKRRMGLVIRVGTLLLLLSFVPLLFGFTLPVLVGVLLVFFMGFNLLEATLPSWLTKTAGVTEKSSVLGLASSSQFLGAFVGGALGGLLIGAAPWLVAVALLATALAGVAAAYFVSEPPYLSTWIGSTKGMQNPEAGCKQALLDPAVTEVVYLEKEQQVLLKYDKKRLTHESRLNLSQVFGVELAL